MLKIPIKVNETTTCGINRGAASADLIKITKLYVWDEAPMMSRYETVEKIHYENSWPTTVEHVTFGGKCSNYITNII